MFFLSDRINQFSFSFSEGDFQRRFVDTLWLRIGKNLVIRYDHDTGVTIRYIAIYRDITGMPIYIEFFVNNN